ncbi:MAG: hypothetical protein SFU56_11195 [Capsulimonadales bacterium]|nr:hypothetical protein [Capsulimonadales bacterium]
MLHGRFAQIAEFASIVLILLGIVCLCQPFFFVLFQNGFSLLLLGWIGLTIFSHRHPILPKPGDSNPSADHGH